MPRGKKAPDSRALELADAVEGVRGAISLVAADVEAWQEQVSGSADLTGALATAHKYLEQALKKADSAHLALAAAHSFYARDDVTEQQSLIPDGDDVTAKSAKNAKDGEAKDG